MLAQLEEDPELGHPCDAELVADVENIQLGKAFRVAVKFQVESGWHIYWHSPRDGAGATRLQWEVPEGFKVGQLQWPTPERLNEDGYISYTYKNQSWLLATVEPPSSWKGDKVTLKAKVKWSVCREVCYEGKKELSLEVAISAKPPKASRDAAEMRQIAKFFPRPLSSDWSIEQHWQLRDSKRGDWTVKLTPLGLPVRVVSVFPFDMVGGRAAEPEIQQTAGSRSIELQFPIKITAPDFDPGQLKALVLVTPLSRGGRGETKGTGSPKQLRSYELHYRGRATAASHPQPKGR